MPMYVYEAKTGGCAKCKSPGFEIMQSIKNGRSAPSCRCARRRY